MTFRGYFDDDKKKPFKQKVEECLEKYYGWHKEPATEVLVSEAQRGDLDSVTDAEGRTIPVKGRTHISPNNIWCGCSEGGE